MTSNRIETVLIALGLLAMSAVHANAASILVNGGFETGTFEGWTASSQDSYFGYFGLGGGGHSGRYEVIFAGYGRPGPGFSDTLSQSFATTPGQSYTIDFWVAHDYSPCGPPTPGVGLDPTCFENFLFASWNGSLILNLTSQQQFGYREFVISQVATGTTSTLKFEGADSKRQYHLDDVSVTAVTPVPEPGSVLLLGSGLAAAVWAQRRGAKFNVLFAAIARPNLSWKNVFDLFSLWFFGAASPAYVTYQIGQQPDLRPKRQVFRVTMKGALTVIIALGWVMDYASHR